MDLREEQQIEIETLLSIYPDEMTLLTVENSDPEVPETFVESNDERSQFTLKISSSEATSGDTGSAVISTLWKFIFPDTYPSVPPEITLLDSGQIPSDSRDDLLKIAIETALDNVGMASVFTVVSTVQDYLNKHAEDCLNRMKDISERAKREEEESERRKMEGTRVTVESFIAWKTKFDAERMKKANKPVEVLGPRRLTGRQMFQENANLDSSDQQLMEDGDEAADIDDREAAADEDFDRDLFEQELLNEEGGDGKNGR